MSQHDHEVNSTDEAATASTPVSIVGPVTLTQDLYCPQCGYNLRGLSEQRCPECGRPFDPGELVVSNIPWVHRRWLGRVRAYVQTVRLVTFHSRRFCLEFSQPVSYHDAQRFRWVTVLLAYGSWLSVTLDETLPDIGLTVAGQCAILLALAAATGIPSYFFHPRSLPLEQQNRGVAMSYYACAPLAWAPVTLLLAWIVSEGARRRAAGVAAGVMVLLQLLAWWLCLVRIARCAQRRGPGGVIAVAVVMPVVWMLAVGTVYIGVETTLKFLGLMFYSLKE